MQTEHKKQYDREYGKKKYLLYKNERMEVLRIYNCECYICKYKNLNELHLHHLYYDENSDYPRTVSGWSRIKRVREAKQFPEKFKLLCIKCHNFIHLVKSKDNYDKLLEVLSMTRL